MFNSSRRLHIQFRAGQFYILSAWDTAAPQLMPGFAGIIGARTAAPSSTTDLERMASALTDNASTVPDARLVEDRVQAKIAWSQWPYAPSALAWNTRGDIALVFIGEDFDSGPKFTRARNQGAPAETEAQALLHAYEEQGSRFLESINGRFTGLVLDLRTREVLLFNDRYGANRIYYHEAVDGFLFSTRAASLLRVAPNRSRFDQQGLAEFYTVGCVMQNRTLFSGVSLLPPGSVWRFPLHGSPKRERYFDPHNWEIQPSLSEQDYTRELIEVFRRVLPKYLRGPQKIGMSLTGGLDSRMILAWAGDADDLPCYTFGGPYRDCADVRIARSLAALTGRRHTTLRIGQDFFTQFPDLAAQSVTVSDGCMDVSGAVEVYVNRLARAIAPIRLTGNYGSEILRSNVAFRPGRVDKTLFTSEFGLAVDAARETYRTEAAGHRLSFIAFKQVPWHHHARFAVEQSELAPRSPFLDNELVALAYRAPRELVTSATPILRLIDAGNPALRKIETDRALRSRKTIRSRIAHRWQEFTAKAEYAYDYGMPRSLVRVDRTLRWLHLEKLFLGRHKFYHFRVWYRDALAATLKHWPASLHAASLAHYKPGIPRRLVTQHTSGHANRTLDLHKLLAVQLLDRSVLVHACRN